MSIQGSRERILDSVLPHEITHMIFASHFRRPLPRWADEGGATSVEHGSERDKYRQMLLTFLRNGRGIAFNQMFAMMEYPPDYMPLYAQGYSLAEFLIQRGGRQRYVEFLDDGLKSDDWSGRRPAALRHQGPRRAARLLAGVGPTRRSVGQAAANRGPPRCWPSAGDGLGPSRT